MPFLFPNKPKSEHMRLHFNSLGGFLPVPVLVCLLLASQVALAGSIGFSVDFAADEISLTNNGTEAGYQFSLWTLDQSAKWREVQILSGNAAYLAPGKSLKGRRHSTPAGSGLGRSDPMLVLLYDQAGGRISQVAWRHAPALAPYSLAIQREGRQLHATIGTASDAKIAVTYGIVVPYEGINELAHGFLSTTPPPDPLRHPWAAGPSMTLDTGAGQGGAWLVHESATGSLQMQIVADGIARGSEQVPVWLNWVRGNLMNFTKVLAALGASLVVTGFVWSLRSRASDRLKS